MSDVITQQRREPAPEEPQRSSFPVGALEPAVGALPGQRAAHGLPAIVVLATVILYYELYIQGAVATQILADYGMSLRYFIFVSVIGNLVGAFGSLAAGLADRWGRANLVAYGLALTGVLDRLRAPERAEQEVVPAAVRAGLARRGHHPRRDPGADPRLLPPARPRVRDGLLDPRAGAGQPGGHRRCPASTLESHPRWQFQFELCGAIGLVVFVIALFGLRELSPRLRDQLMVSARDRALIEARAAGHRHRARPGRRLAADVQARRARLRVRDQRLPALLLHRGRLLRHLLRAQLRLHARPARTRLANWYWIANAIAWSSPASCRTGSASASRSWSSARSSARSASAIFAVLATHPDTGYYTFAWLLALSARRWRHGLLRLDGELHRDRREAQPGRHRDRPRGLGLDAAHGRHPVAARLHARRQRGEPSSSTRAPKVQELAAEYEPQLATIAKVDPTVLGTLSANPTDAAAGATAVSQISGVPVGDVAARWRSTPSSSRR